MQSETGELTETHSLRKTGTGPLELVARYGCLLVANCFFLERIFFLV